MYITFRNYKRKTDRKPITPALVTEAQHRNRQGDSLRQIARDFKVDESSLRKRLKLGYGVTCLGKFKKTFTDEQESALAEHCRQMDLRFYGVTRKSFRQLAYQYAIQNRIPHQFNSGIKMAGEDWTKSFIARYNLSLRIPQKTSVGRIMGFNKRQVDIFYENLKLLFTKYEFRPSRTYNVDETGITTVPNKIPKIITNKGKRSVNKVTSAERGQLVTAVCCFSAGGHYIPPALIFPRKRMKPELMNGAPSESIMLISDSGYISTELFCQWLKHFQKHARASKEDPVLLILDNHSSHCTLEAVTYCKERHIHLVSIPPHSSHKTQPLDRNFFKTLKDFYSDVCDQWLVNNPGRTITQSEVAKLFGDAYSKTCTIERAENAFRVCGIVPLNKFIFSEEDFLPASVTDQTERYATIHHDDRPTPKNYHPISTDTVTGNDTSSEDDIPLIYIRKPLAAEPNFNLGRITPQPSTSKFHENAESTASIENQSPDTTMKSPCDILPYPKIAEKRIRKRKGKKSTILTSTPNEEELKRERQEKIEKERKKRATKFLSKNKSAAKEARIFCPACDLKYEEPPIEDWIQCSVCQRWWHENCSCYETGQFVCDFCSED